MFPSSVAPVDDITPFAELGGSPFLASPSGMNVCANFKGHASLRVVPVRFFSLSFSLASFELSMG